MAFPPTQFELCSAVAESGQREMVVSLDAQSHLPPIVPLQYDLSLIFLVSSNLLFPLPQFLLVCEFESVLLKRINPWMALFQMSQLLLWNINKKFQKSTFSCFIMWDKAGAKQISPTGRQSPHTHNDSLNHPSHFPERVYGLSATQVHIHLSPAWLGAKHLLHRFMEYFGLERMLEVTWATPICSPKRAFPGLTAEDHKFFWSEADCQPYWRSYWPWEQVALLTLRDTKTILKKIHQERMTTGSQIAVYESKCKM